MGALELLGKRQASWSATANRLKSRIDTVRGWVFALAIVGAVLATIASQAHDKFRAFAAIAGAIALGVGTFLTSRLANATHTGGWVRARAISEALKREAYKFAAKAAPYDGSNAEVELSKERERIENGIDDDLVALLIDADKVGSAPTADLSPDDYMETRVRNQIKYYRDAAGRSRDMATRLRTIEFVLALTATIITAGVGVLDKYPVPAFPFDFAALTAILTTIGGLILAHIEASRYDFLVTTYYAAARRLENALADLGDVAAPSPVWTMFVDRCESIIAMENSSWIAKRIGNKGSDA